MNTNNAMIIKKRLPITILLAISLLLTTLAVPSSMVYAGEAPVDGDLSLEEGAKPYVQSAEDKKLLDEKNADVEANVPDDAGIVPFADTWYKLAIPLYTQSNGYYCGPATVKEVVQFHKGSSSSQATYAKKLGTTSDGTDMTKIPSVLSAESGRKYVYASIEDQATWKKRIIRNITGTKLAVVMDIKTTKDFWRYATSGHFLAIRGYKGTASTVSNVQMSDPHPDCSGEYYVKTAANAYKANNSHWRKAMIW